MKRYAVIDTNVLVSALLAKRDDSPTVVLIEKIFEDLVIPVFSRNILDEYAEVLHREKFGFAADTVDEFLLDLGRRGILLESGQRDLVLPDIKDVPFYAAALTNGQKETYLITGNLKHFPVKSFIVTPAQFLAILQQEE